MRQEKILENQAPFHSTIVSSYFCLVPLNTFYLVTSIYFLYFSLFSFPLYSYCIIQIGVPVNRSSDILEYCCGVSQIGEWAGPTSYSRPLLNGPYCCMGQNINKASRVCCTLAQNLPWQTEYMCL